jgi:hypothetical protein
MGRRKRDGNIPQNKVVQELEQSEKNGYPDADSNKANRNYMKESNKAHKNKLKEEILQVINENFIELLIDIVNKKCTGGTQEIQRQQKQRI